MDKQLQSFSQPQSVFYNFSVFCWADMTWDRALFFTLWFWLHRYTACIRCAIYSCHYSHDTIKCKNSVNVKSQTKCHTHAFKSVSHFLKTICRKLSSSWVLIASQHATMSTKLQPDDAWDTCVINKVRIRVDVFAVKERKKERKKGRKNLLILLLAILLPQFSFYNNKWRI